MMRFRYVGPEDQVTIFGATFPRGEPVEVLDPAAAHKLLHHPEFAPADDEALANAVTGDLMESTNAHAPGADHVRAADAPRPRRRRNAGS